jgi:hypothetical protein
MFAVSISELFDFLLVQYMQIRLVFSEICPIRLDDKRFQFDDGAAN